MAPLPLITLDKVVVPEGERGSGVGTEFMEELTTIADDKTIIMFSEFCEGHRLTLFMKTKGQTIHDMKIAKL